MVLTGFMGAGKTTVGRILAPLLGWNFLDIDESLVQHHGGTIAELFSRHGESSFRDWEALRIAEALHREYAVIALGGGALEREETHQLLTRDPATLLVYLQTSLAVSLQRCSSERGATRPVLTTREGVERRFLARLPLYETAALTLSADHSAPEALAQTIADRVRDGD